MACLTLARYINETALMSYKIVTQKESLIAAGCLRLAMLMSHPEHSWVRIGLLNKPNNLYPFGNIYNIKHRTLDINCNIGLK